MPKVVDKTVKMNLAGRDGNAFALLGAFRHHAKRQGWTADEVDAVCKAATGGDYEHLLRVLIAHTETLEPGELED